MPTSNLSQVQAIMETVTAHNPRSILDIGVGFGKYGFLCREYLDVFSADAIYGKWKRRIEGVEAFPDYLTPVHGYIYDKVHVGNALDVLPKLATGEYDLVMIIDVIEHFEFPDAHAILDQCARIGRNVLVSTPRDIGQQDEVFSNPFEVHKAQFTKAHFASKPNCLFVNDWHSIIAFYGEDGAWVRKVLRKRALLQMIRDYLPFAWQARQLVKNLR